MPRKLVALNLALAAVSAVFVAYIVRQLLAPTPLPVPGRRAPVVAAATSATVEAPRPPATAYAVVAARNLFSPTRSEGPATTTTANLGPMVRPNLYGIVVRDGGSIAYLEDPVTKRVVGYRVGDKIVGGTVQSIKADAVIIERPEGPVDVRLRDPGKPRAVTTATQPGMPPVGVQPSGLQSTPPMPALPGVIPPAASPGQPVPPQVAQPPQMQPQPAQPGVMPPNVQPPGVMPPGVRRTLPPNLLRRVPPGMGDAPQQ
jgi:hypothetical protein